MKSNYKNFNDVMKEKTKSLAKLQEVKKKEAKVSGIKKINKKNSQRLTLSFNYFLRQDSNFTDPKNLKNSDSKTNHDNNTLEAIIKNLTQKIKFLEDKMNELQNMEKEDENLSQTLYINYLEEKIRKLEEITGPIQF